MVVRHFYLLGEPPFSSRPLDVDTSITFRELQYLIAGHFAIVNPDGIAFQCRSHLTRVSDIISTTSPISISVDGRPIRNVPGPKGIPYIGNYLEIYPDHLGNHQRLFEHYGCIFQTHIFGRILYHTNDPAIASIAFSETCFFTKNINQSHPLHGIKNNDAGIFIGDTETDAWRMAHRLFPPAFSPKAVRHYAPTIQAIVEESTRIFDRLDCDARAWNVYHYMLKLACQQIGKIVLGKDLGHFSATDAPLHELVILFGETLHLNKKVTYWGNWYSMLPFGDPKRLRRVKQRLDSLIEQCIDTAELGGTELLTCGDAASKAANIVACGPKDLKLPRKNLIQGLEVIVGAGFTTTSSLLSWLVYSLVAYPGVQERILQELVDHDIQENTPLNPDLVNKLSFLDNFVKETQRRHNPSYQPARTAKVDLILPGAFRIPKGAVIVPALHHIHNNPAVWSNPASFQPDRWDRTQTKQRAKNAYMPFAAGPRMCIGFNLALQEVKVIMVKLVYRYNFTRECDDAIEYDPLHQVVVPTNLYVRAQKRAVWPKKSS